MPPWSLQNSQNWLIFSHVEKNCQKNIIFCAGPPPPPELHIRIFSFSDSCTPVHWILFYLQIHVPGYMIFCFFFRSIYPGTWYFVFSSNPSTRVHGILIFLQIHVPGYMKYWFFSLFLCVAQVAEARVFIFLFFWQFFSRCYFFFNFWNFVKIKVAKFKLNQTG